MGGMFSSSSKSSSKDDDDEDDYDKKELKHKMCWDDCEKKCGKSQQNNAALFSLYGGSKKRKSAFRKSLIKAKSKGKGKATRKRVK